MQKENLDEYVKKVSDVLDSKIKIITSIVYHYDLEEIISSLKKLSESNIEIVLEDLINKRLDQIRKSKRANEFREDFKDNNKLRQFNLQVSEVTDFFYDEELKDKEIYEEGGYIAINLVLKTIGVNDRKIMLPVKISYIKEYCIDNAIEKKYIMDIILWIFIELSVMNYFFNY